MQELADSLLQQLATADVASLLATFAGEDCADRVRVYIQGYVLLCIFQSDHSSSEPTQPFGAGFCSSSWWLLREVQPISKAPEDCAVLSMMQILHDPISALNAEKFGHRF